MSLRRMTLAASAFASTWCLGCGPGSVGEAARPEPPTAAAALDDEPPPPECNASPQYVEPLIVDWKSNRRLDLEVAMKDGVAVVRYECDKFEPIKTCSVRGSYGYAAVSRKEDVLQLNNSDELRANLPLSAASFGAELKRGASLDLALVMVGKKSSTVKKPGRGELIGECDRATHVVRGAVIGAFAMKSGSVGKVTSVAELFGAGASGTSVSSKSLQSRDGELAACRKSTSGDEAPVNQCESAIRLELVPIADDSAESVGEKPEKEEDKVVVNPCPDGFTLSGGKCAKKGAADAYLCAPHDVEDCAKQCDKGSAGSCRNLAVAYEQGRNTDKDLRKARDLFVKACDLGSLHACSYGALYFEQGFVNGEKDPARGKAMKEKACDGGFGRGCWSLGFRMVDKDAEGARKLYERGCNLGDRVSCDYLARLYLEGRHMAKDVEKGIEVLERVCNAKSVHHCIRLAYLYDSEKSAVHDVEKATDAWRRACHFHNGPGHNNCTELARRFREGIGVTKDLLKAKEYYERSCDLADSHPGVEACFALGTMYEDGNGVEKNKATASKYWSKICSLTKSCSQMKKRLPKALRPKAKALFKYACQALKDDASCKIAKELGAK